MLKIQVVKSNVLYITEQNTMSKFVSSVNHCDCKYKQVQHCYCHVGLQECKHGQDVHCEQCCIHGVLKRLLPPTGASSVNSNNVAPAALPYATFDNMVKYTNDEEKKHPWSIKVLPIFLGETFRKQNVADIPPNSSGLVTNVDVLKGNRVPHLDYFGIIEHTLCDCEPESRHDNDVSIRALC
jgi:hypothetical protein